MSVLYISDVPNHPCVTDTAKPLIQAALVNKIMFAVCALKSDALFR